MILAGLIGGCHVVGETTLGIDAFNLEAIL